MLLAGLAIGVLAKGASTGERQALAGGAGVTVGTGPTSCSLLLCRRLGPGLLSVRRPCLT